MTNRAIVARSTEISWDGAGIMVLTSDKLDLVNAVTEQSAVYVPFPATIKLVRSRVRTTSDANAVAQLKGVVKGATPYAQQTHGTSHTAGTELTWAITDDVVPAGEVLYFASDGGASAAGAVDVTVVLVPQEG